MFQLLQAAEFSSISQVSWLYIQEKKDTPKKIEAGYLELINGEKRRQAKLKNDLLENAFWEQNNVEFQR